MDGWHQKMEINTQHRLSERSDLSSVAAVASESLFILKDISHIVLQCSRGLQKTMSSLSTDQTIGTATSASVNPVAPTNSASPDKTDSITIVLSIIGAILTLASVIIAILQYRIQAKKKLDIERDGQAIEMIPQASVREVEVEGIVADPPAPPS
jgi:beta-lactamase regulating signal transducer with metallopeptidase domain